MILPADNFPAIDIYRLVDMIILQSENKTPSVGPFTIMDTNDQEDYIKDHIIEAQHYNKHLLSRTNYENHTLKSIRATNRTILIYGEGSAFTTNVLRERGFNAIMVCGNINEFKKLFPKGLLSSSGVEYNVLKLKETIQNKRQEKNGSRLWRSTSASRLRTASRDTRSRGAPNQTAKPWK